METPQGTSNVLSRQKSFKSIDDVTSLTTFNPFSEEDEHDQSSYAIVTSLLSLVKNTLTAPLTSSSTNNPNIQYNNMQPKEPPPVTNPPPRVQSERPSSLSVISSTTPAPPLVFLTPVISEAPSLGILHDGTPTRGGMAPSPIEPNDPAFGTTIPGFPIADDARSVRTSGSGNLQRTASVSKIIRRIRGEGLSRDYWMDDAKAKECYDCKSVFTTWRRKHHCRICGQIFCSRCASNIIKGSRFGQEGMVRVCNLCLEKLEKGGADDDEDDRRSVMSGATSQMAVTHSPFAASQIFYRNDEPFNLYSIAETRRQLSDDGSASSRSRSITPALDYDIPVPFRRNLADEEREREERDRLHLSSPVDYPRTNTGQSSIAFPSNDTGDESTIQFPGSSSNDPAFSPDMSRPMSLRTSRVNSFAETEIGAVPFLRSRVQSRLEWPIGPESGWRTRRESTAYAQELNAISMFHLRIVLRQMLTREGVPNVKEWEETLLRLSLQIARDLTFFTTSSSMDVRQHVKIKKIPGGSPRDSEYVDGAVITQNVAHKHMARTIRNPRVMLVTFPFEFHRVEGQYMHLDPLVNQEKQYLTNLVGRVAALRPHLLLVERSVSRIALEALLEQNIAVARSVKPSAIQLVARMTQADVLSSMDKLAVEPRLGHCTRFQLQTFDHPLIPGRRKTYMRFEGCYREMGCTIILRGGDIALLRRIKNVTRFLVFVVRNLKMETHLWKDSVITLPPVTADAIPASASTAALLPNAPTVRARTFSIPTLSFLANAGPEGTMMISPPQPRWTLPSTDFEGDTVVSPTVKDDAVFDDEDLSPEDAAQIKLSQRIRESVEPYIKNFISVSATIRFSPPYPIRRMKELDELLRELKAAWEDEVIEKEEKRLSRHDRDVTIKALELEASPLILPELQAMPGALPNLKLGEPAIGYFDYGANKETDMGAMRDSIASIVVPALEASDADEDFTTVEKPVPFRQVSDIAKESTLSLAQFQFDEHRPVWEWYLRKNADDFAIGHYQTLAVREFIAPLAEVHQCKPCHMPVLSYFTYYGENDCTLGHFIEKAVVEGLIPVTDNKPICSSCEEPVAAHCKVYVHNESKLIIVAEPWSGKIQAKSLDAPIQDLVTTWSVCRRCGQATPFIPVSEETLRYSFAKFVELYFYPADVLIVPGAGCAHNIYLDHTRYFAYKGTVIRFHTEPILLQEIIFPPRRIRVRPETLLELKNSYYIRMLGRNATWFGALIHDLKLLLIELGDSNPDASIKAAAYIREADKHRIQLARDIHRIYQESPPTDTLALGRARQLLQEHMFTWQSKLDMLPKPREKEIRRVSGLGSVIWSSKRNESTTTLDKSSTMSEAEDALVRRRMVQSSASETESTYEEKMTSTPSLPTNPDAEKEPLSQGQVQESPEGTEIQDSVAELAPADSEPTPRAVVESLAELRIPKSDAESDSTISGSRALSRASNNRTYVSRLPRPTAPRIKVTALVKRYEPPEQSEPPKKSPVAATSPSRVRRTRTKKAPSKQPFLSDFEQSYAANIAPKYLTGRRQQTHPNHLSKIPGPVTPGIPETRNRQASPEKRSRANTPLPGTAPRGYTLGDLSSKTIKGKGTQRIASRERSTIRNMPANAGRSTLRRSNTNTKVSTLARHFERISKDSERTTRPYAVLRGRRARPVASGPPSVHVIENLQQVIFNESESNDESSDADDEEDGEEEEVPQLLPGSSDSQPSSSGGPSTSESPAESLDATPPESSKEPSPTTAQMIPVHNSHTSRQSSLNTPISSSINQSFFSSMPPSPGLPSLRSNSPALTPSDHVIQEKGSFIKALSVLWSQQQNLPNLADSFEDLVADPVHIHKDSPIALRTDEPTSIIAVALSCKDYRERQKAARLARRKSRIVSESSEAYISDDHSLAESSSSWGLVDLDQPDDEGDAIQFLKQSSGSEYAWSFDFAFDDLIITCVLMFPEQFHALRRIFECEKSIIESLARCVKWNVKGGKSGSGFLKTQDDRFIAKELSKAEMRSMATFAPAYFDYMASTIVAGRPTLLAKIFGCYRISFTRPKDAKRGIKTKTASSVFLVMENLFYDRRFTKIYDLKGSTRNRHVPATGKENEVLLDENLVKTAHLNPLYIREHSKRILRATLWNDTKFLSDFNVMDYSLVVGIDSVKNELVLGIVDFIRTYTWDKKLESWVKDASFLGGGAEPTIVTPKQYKARFRSAMERYFPLVPDRWMKQRDHPNEEGDNLLDLWSD
ncbi:hypothetical protein Clacol_000081 [Clathrus columnatus]|uniref:1-phosphatidylinositol-3-phosphate 5-kinase n=1 Tax=Clathrus columnatus TaxID=1419009 RepID=A0AAV4ZW84_9AGAM|nr:hypothetical protein Clacol_000081 [Clathrus columnatus]